MCCSHSHLGLKQPALPGGSIICAFYFSKNRFSNRTTLWLLRLSAISLPCFGCEDQVLPIKTLRHGAAIPLIALLIMRSFRIHRRLHLFVYQLQWRFCVPDDFTPMPFRLDMSSCNAFMCSGINVSRASDIFSAEVWTVWVILVESDASWQGYSRVDINLRENFSFMSFPSSLIDSG